MNEDKEQAIAVLKYILAYLERGMIEEALDVTRMSLNALQPVVVEPEPK